MDTLTPVFDWILAASVRAALLTVVVLAAQAALRHRAPARWRHALWLPVLIVLLMPAFPESAWSVRSITRLATVPFQESEFSGHSIALPATSSLAVADETPVPAPIPWQQIFCGVWLSGAAGMLLMGIAAYAQTLWRFHRSRLLVSDALQRELTTLAREICLRRVPRVWVASAIHSPAVTGLLRPTLLLPAHFEQALTTHETRLVLQHELMHIKRGDLPVHALLCLLLALHWFNPLLWLAFFKARIDREAACDAQVLDRADQAQRVAYGHTLLKVETAFSHHGLSLGFVGIFQRGAALRVRIQSIASRPSPHPLMKPALAFGLVFLTFLGITQAATPDANAPRIFIMTKFVELSEKETIPPSASSLPAPLEVVHKVPGQVGILTDAEFQVLIRTLSQRKGVDLLSAPSVTTRSGQQARLEVVREFIYPDETHKAPRETVWPDPVSPGVSLEVLPKMTAEGRIELDLSSQVVEFEGFTEPRKDAEEPVIYRKRLYPDGTATESVSDGKKGEASESTFDARGVLLAKKTVPASDARKEPIFKTRKAKVKVAISSGETLVLEMEPRKDEQIVEDVNFLGRTTRRTDVFQRRLFVFVTASRVEPPARRTRGR